MPEDDAALDLVAEAGVAGGGHDLLGARVVDALGQHPQAVAHGVELGEVGGRLARQDQVVGRERVVEARAGHLDDLGAGLLEQRHRLVEAGAHAGLVALAAELLDDADPEPLDVGPAGRLDDRRDRRVDGGGVQRVVPADDRVQQRGVEHRAGARAGLVQAGRQRDEAVAGDAAVGRLDADGAGDGGGLADRAAGVGADGQRRLVGGDDRGRSRRRSRRGCG